MDGLIFTILRPEEVRVARLLHDEEGDLIVVTVAFEWEGETVEGEIAFEPDGFMSFLVAGLNGLGFGEGDLEYLADRFNKDFR
jgi:hypothetical protein